MPALHGLLHLLAPNATPCITCTSRPHPPAQDVMLPCNNGRTAWHMPALLCGLLWDANSSCCAPKTLIPCSRMFSIVGLVGTTFTSILILVTSAQHGPLPASARSGPKDVEQFFTGATNLLFTFGGHAMCVEVRGCRQHHPATGHSRSGGCLDKQLTQCTAKPTGCTLSMVSGAVPESEPQRPCGRQ